MQVLKLCLVFSTLLDFVLCIDPLSSGVILGASVLGYSVNRAWDTLKCPLYECCSLPWLKHNVTQLEELLDQHVFGQHLVRKIVTKALRAHLRKEKPRKALVLSFHGWTGSGKNYVAKFIAESYDLDITQAEALRKMRE